MIDMTFHLAMIIVILGNLWMAKMEYDQKDYKMMIIFIFVALTFGSTYVCAW